jgi:hypothetical protein
VSRIASARARSFEEGPDSWHRLEILSAFMAKSRRPKAKMLSQETVKSARVLRRGKVSDMVFAALVKTLGHSRAETMDFYLDTRLAVDDPERYEESVKLLLGEHGSGLVIEGIKTEIANTAGIERSAESLAAQVRATEGALRKASRRAPAKPAKAWA